MRSFSSDLEKVKPVVTQTSANIEHIQARAYSTGLTTYKILYRANKRRHYTVIGKVFCITKVNQLVQDLSKRTDDQQTVCKEQLYILYDLLKKTKDQQSLYSQ
jgi:hypothetical protein